MTNFVYILDGNLARIGVIEGWSSIIWAKRYWTNGDCEIYTAATPEALQLASTGVYIERPDDDMVCRIDRIELTTSAENGDYLTIHGTDVKQLLDQRIIWSATTAQGVAETFARQLVSDALIVPIYAARQAVKPNGQTLLSLAPAAGFTEPSTEQVTYKNLGAKIEEICRRYGWGSRITRNGSVLAFELYAGVDRSNSVFFAEEYDNLISTDYLIDRTRIMNVALVGGSGEGALRICEPAGVTKGTARWEQFIDAKDESSTITWKDLVTAYPLVADGGYGSIVPRQTGYAYNMSQFDVQILDDEQRIRIANKYPGGIYFSSLDGGCYYRVTNVDIATLDSMTPADADPVVLTYIAYSPRLMTIGYDSLAGYGEQTSFDGEIEPNTNFVFGVDYDLGDIVTIRSSYGVTAAVRITEVIESEDENGYRVEPKFEYQN